MGDGPAVKLTGTIQSLLQIRKCGTPKEGTTVELSDCIYALEIACDNITQWQIEHPDDFLFSWSEATRQAIKTQLDKVQA